MTKTFCDLCGEQCEEYIEFDVYKIKNTQICIDCACNCHLAYKGYFDLQRGTHPKEQSNGN